MANNVKIISGADEQNLTSVVGKTILEVKNLLQDSGIITIPEPAIVYLNNVPQSDFETVLEVGDTLEFMRKAGEKG